MYPEAEVLLKLSPLEMQPALAIDLDRDPSQALQFFKEKIVDKYFQAPCELASVSIKETAPMKIKAMQEFLLLRRLSRQEMKV